MWIAGCSVVVEERERERGRESGGNIYPQVWELLKETAQEKY